MKVEQYVMAYGVEHDRLRAIIPDAFVSLRPVLRINAEIINDRDGYIEFNTAVEKDGNKGWLNIAFRNDVSFAKNGKTTVFNTDYLEISFTRSGINGSCPAEKDNAGCYFIGENERLVPPEVITEGKEFCDCSFKWKFTAGDARGASEGKTVPAYPEEVKNVYPKENFTAENAAKIPCKQVLGTYAVNFNRK